MNKILLGLSILLSVALLSGCGSGSKGSAGADGAAGATGATGATGASGAAGTAAGLTSILVPDADANLTLTASASVDTDLDLGQVGRLFYLTGVDNETADSRLRYHAYLGASSTAKTFVAVSAGTNGISASRSVPFDTRVHAAGEDNITITLVANQNLGAGDGDVTHMIICPGNDAGDATSCANVAINDRGLGAMYVSSPDNVSRVWVTQNSATSFSLVTADSADTGADNVTATQALSDDKNQSILQTLAAAQTVGTHSGGNAADPSAFSTIMDSVIHSSSLYVLSATDNGTLDVCGTSGCSTAATSIFSVKAGSGGDGNDVDSTVILDSDGTNMIGIADNGTSIAVMNLTTPGTPVRVGNNIAVESIHDTFCGAVGGGRVLVATDNATDNRSTGAHSQLTTDVIFHSTGIDNTTGWDVPSYGILATLDNTSRTGNAKVGADGSNDAFQINCAMTYAGTSGTTRTFYMAIDNSTTVAVYKIVDNTSFSGGTNNAAGGSLYVTGLGNIPLGGNDVFLSYAGSSGGTGVQSISIDADSDGNPWIAVDNKSGMLYGGETLSEVALTGIHGPIDVKVSSDGKKIAVAGVSTDYDNRSGIGFPAVRIWYQE